MTDDGACNRAVNDDDVGLVKSFVTLWLHDAMGRAWSAVDSPETTLSKINVLHLFRGLITPFGDTNASTCIPKQFWCSGSPPPRNWQFLERAVGELFHQWDETKETPSDAEGLQAGTRAPRRPQAGRRAVSTSSQMSRASSLSGSSCLSQIPFKLLVVQSKARPAAQVQSTTSSSHVAWTVAAPTLHFCGIMQSLCG